MVFRQSQLFPHTQKQPPSGEKSTNARLLEQGGFVAKLMAGVYSYLPLGLRVLRKVEGIIREEMNAIGAQELFLPALQPKELWDQSGRWDSLREVMYQFQDHSERSIGLAVTHEEVIAELLHRHVSSYKDLPLALYQIQTKFRHELRAKSGVTRGREFSMKDLYSAHVDQADCDRYYEIVKQAYLKIFSRVHLDARVVEASGGDFSKDVSHEFQVITEAGEDHLLLCDACDFAQNNEIAKVRSGESCPRCAKGKIHEKRGIEVGNIFKLGTKYSEAMGAHFASADGTSKALVLASYGIGLSRTLGTIVEVYNDAEGILWPESVAPFTLHILQLGKQGPHEQRAEALAQSLARKGIETLFDERQATAGEKLHDADLLGIPHRVIVSQKTGEKIEYRSRASKSSELITEAELLQRLGH